MLEPFFQNQFIEAGCDEAGRGCLAGPVVAAAVILPFDYRNDSLNDSKILSESKRDQLRLIIQSDAIAWAIGICDNDEIDKINILNASFLAMHRALDGLNQRPAFIIVDGNRFNPYKNLPHKCVVKGDGKYLSIAAASILAKTARDEIMKGLSMEFPGYRWEKNKGYPTKDHVQALNSLGQTKYHRKSFHLKQQLKFDF